MTDLPFWQQAIVSAMQGLGVGAAAAVGWVLVRRSERIKWDEQQAADVRKLQLDALLQVLTAIGRFHNTAARRASAVNAHEADPTVGRAEWLKECAEAHGSSFTNAVDTLASVHFLLGTELGGIIRTALLRLGRAKEPAAAEAALDGLEKTLERWIPPLKRSP
jgi:hypothetical protein